MSTTYIPVNLKLISDIVSVNTLHEALELEGFKDTPEFNIYHTWWLQNFVPFTTTHCCLVSLETTTIQNFVFAVNVGLAGSIIYVDSKKVSKTDISFLLNKAEELNFLVFVDNI